MENKKMATGDFDIGFWSWAAWMRIMRTKSDIQKHCLIIAVVCVGVVIACLIIGRY